MVDTLGIYKDNLLIITIFATCFFILSLPVYVYGTYKFWVSRNHILIQKRFPAISLAIIIASFLTGFINTIIRWVHYVTNDHISPEISSGCVFFVYGLINIRLSVIYLRWKHNQSLLTQITTNNNEIELSIDSFPSTPSTDIKSSVTNNDNKVTERKRIHEYYHYSNILLLVITILGSFYIALADPTSIFYGMIMSVGWIFHIITSIILISIVRCKKVSEGIGCLKESAFMLIFQLLFVFIGPLIFIDEKFVVPMMIIFNLVTYIQAIIPLYFPLYYVHKMEKISVSSQNNKTENVNDVDLDCPLHVFLEKECNYKIFKEYLSFCWAIENILFYEKVAIFHQIVVKYKKMNAKKTEKEQNTADVDDIDVDIIHRTKFEYLAAIYGKYESTIGDKTKFEDLKEIMFKMSQNIIDSFVKIESEHQINISSEVREQTVFLLDNDTKMEKFESFDDFFCLFDPAMTEIYQLMLSMYHYQFKQYIKSKTM